MISANSKEKTVLAIMFFAVIVSGCTGGGNSEETSSTMALQVNEFSAFPNPTPGDQNTRFRMQVQNVGDSEAVNVSARLYNPPFADDSSDEKTWRDTDSDDRDISESDRTLHFGSLNEPNDQTPSVPGTQTVTFVSPNLSEGRQISYDMNSYLMYEYNTEATTEIQIMSGDRYREAGSPSGTATLDNSQGPIQMEIRTPTPIRFYDVADQDYVTRELCVIVRNQGNGVPFNDVQYEGEDNGDGTGYDIAAVQSNKSQVNVDIEDIGSVEFRQTDSDDDWGANQPAQEVEILNGRGINCWDMNVSVGSSAQLQRTVPLTLRADYGYRQSAKTTATVEGRRN